MTLRRLVLVVALMIAGILSALAGRLVDEPARLPEAAMSAPPAAQRPPVPDAVAAPSSRM